MNSLRKTSTLLAITVVCMVIVVFLQVIAPLRVVAAILLVLFLPGYTITRAAFPHRAWGIAERTLFSLGASLCVAVLSGLALNWTRWGMQVPTWTLFMGGVTVFATLIGALRQRDNQSEDGVLPGRLPTRTIALFAISIVLIVSAYGISAYGATLRPAAQFTQLWILPSDQAGSVRVGVRNEERATTDYRLVVRAGVEVVQEWPSIALGQGEQWDTVLELTPAQAASITLVASLYRQDDPNIVYRYVTLRSAR